MTPPPHGRGNVARAAYVYLLRSVRDGKFYTGWTTDVQRRLTQHNSGQVRSTRFRRPLTLLHAEMFPSIQDAKQREGALKHNPNMLQQFKKRMKNCAAATVVDREVVG